jgi:hypothetical protein
MADLAGWTERYNSIINGTTGTIKISPWTGPNPNAPVYAIPSIGIAAVRASENYISQYSAKYGVDKKLMESIVYVENSQGYYDFGLGASVKSANIIPEL